MGAGLGKDIAPIETERVKRGLIGGATDVTTYFVLRLAADGTEATGLAITDIDLQYVRSGAAPSAKVDATALASAGAAHGDNQAIEIDSTDQKGLYRVDWPDAAFAAGVKEVILTVTCATCFVEHLRVIIDAPVNVVKWVGTAVTLSGTTNKPEADIASIGDSAANAVNLGLACTNYTAARGLTGTAVPNAAADAMGGLPISDAGGLDLDAMNANVSSILTDTGTTLDDHMTDIKGTGFAKDTHSLTDILADVTGLNGDAMRGTDSAALASVCTEDRLAELDAANLPADVDAILADTGTDGVKIATSAISAASFATGAIDAAAIAADAVTEIANGVFAITIDGVAFSSMMKSLQAYAYNETNVTDIGGDELRVDYKDRAGTSDVLKVTHSTVTAGLRTASVIV